METQLSRTPLDLAANSKMDTTNVVEILQSGETSDLIICLSQLQMLSLSYDSSTNNIIFNSSLVLLIGHENKTISYLAAKVLQKLMTSVSSKSCTYSEDTVRDLCHEITKSVVNKSEIGPNFAVAQTLDLLSSLICLKDESPVPAILLQELVPVLEKLLRGVQQTGDNYIQLKTLTLFSFLRLLKKVMKHYYHSKSFRQNEDVNIMKSFQSILCLCDVLLDMVCSKELSRMCLLKCLSILCQGLPVGDLVMTSQKVPKAALSLCEHVLGERNFDALLQICNNSLISQSLGGETTIFVESYSQVCQGTKIADDMDMVPPFKKCKRENDEKQMCIMEDSTKLLPNESMQLDTRHTQGVIMLVLKSCAILAQQWKEPDSDSVPHSVVMRSTMRVLTAVSQQIPTPASFGSLWMFAEQDDQLIEAMLCLLLTYQAVEECISNPQSSCDTEKSFLELANPHKIFLRFLQDTAWDSNLLLDLLTGPETCFTAYFVKYLRYTEQKWMSFCEACKDLLLQEEAETEGSLQASSDTCDEAVADSQESVQIFKQASSIGCSGCANAKPPGVLVNYSDSDSEDEHLHHEKVQLLLGSKVKIPQENLGMDKAMTVLIRLRLSVERLSQANLFPYNVKPILNALGCIENLYGE